MLCSKGWLGRFLGFFSAAVGCVAMAMTYSRASWVGLAFAAVVFVVLWNRKLIPFGILAALVVLAILPDTVFNRILTIFNTSDTSTKMCIRDREKKVYPVPDTIDDAIGRAKLAAQGLSIDVLTPEQEAYLSSWSVE